MRSTCAPRIRLLILGLVIAAGCGGEEDQPEGKVGPIPAYPQRAGDADAGWRALIEKGYVGCGIPRSAYDMVFAPAPISARLDRGGINATLPYNFKGSFSGNTYCMGPV